MSLTKRTPEHPRSCVLATAAEAVAEAVEEAVPVPEAEAAAVEEAAPMPAVAEAAAAAVVLMPAVAVAVPTVAAEAAAAAAEAAAAASGFGGAAAAAVAVEAIGAGCQATVGPGVIDIAWCCRAGPDSATESARYQVPRPCPTEADALFKLALPLDEFQ
jgi:hypothetical protein